MSFFMRYSCCWHFFISYIALDDNHKLSRPEKPNLSAGPISFVYPARHPESHPMRVPIYPYTGQLSKGTLGPNRVSFWSTTYL